MTMNSNSAVDVGYMSPKEVERAKAEQRSQLNLKHNQAQRETIQEAKIEEILDQLTFIESVDSDQLVQKKDI